MGFPTCNRERLSALLGKKVDYHCLGLCRTTGIVGGSAFHHLKSRRPRGSTRKPQDDSGDQLLLHMRGYDTDATGRRMFCIDA